MMITTHKLTRRSLLGMMGLGALAACGAPAAPTAIPATQPPAPTSAPATKAPAAPTAIPPTSVPAPTAAPQATPTSVPPTPVPPTRAPTAVPTVDHGAHTATTAPAATATTAAPTKAPAASQPAATQPPAPPAGATVQAAITLFAFKPGRLEIAAGTTVVWTNNDLIEHSVTHGTPEAKGNVFDSGFFTRGKTFAFKFDKPGVYPYYCMRHTSMTGEVVVK